MNDLIKSVLLLTIIFASVATIGVAYARSTQYVTTGANVPHDMICVRDTFPDAYYCSYDAAPSYLKSKENYHD